MKMVILILRISTITICLLINSTSYWNNRSITSNQEEQEQVQEQEEGKINIKQCGNHSQKNSR